MLMKIPSNAATDDDTTESPDGQLDGAIDFYEAGPNNGDLDPTFEDDFAEYMWMMNEEEFDKEEMQRLEEEALMEQCIEAMFELDRAHRRALDEGRTLVLPDEVIDGEAVPINADGSEVSQELCKVLSLLKLNGAGADAADDGLEDSPIELATGEPSSLNPLAEEFVPAELPATST